MQSLKQEQEEKVKVKEISDPLLDVKIERVCAGLQLSFANKLKSLTIKDNIFLSLHFSAKSSNLLILHWIRGYSMASFER
jgi:hypothetical protein